MTKRLMPAVLILLLSFTMETNARQSATTADERALSALVERWTAARGHGFKGLVDHTYEMYGEDGAKIGVGYTTLVALKDGGTSRIAAVRYISAWPAVPAAPSASGT